MLYCYTAYKELREQKPSVIFLVEIGDFYEALEDQADILEKVCGITVATRLIKKGERVKSAAIPYWQVEDCKEKLQSSGYTVEVIE